MAQTPDHVALTLDGSLDDHGVRPGAMRWMPPEHAAARRDAVRRAIAAARLDRRMNDRGIPVSRRPR